MRLPLQKAMEGRKIESVMTELGAAAVEFRVHESTAPQASDE
jgi:hypothetical protein